RRYTSPCGSCRPARQWLVEQNRAAPVRLVACGACLGACGIEGTGVSRALFSHMKVLLSSVRAGRIHTNRCTSPWQRLLRFCSSAPSRAAAGGWIAAGLRVGEDRWMGLWFRGFRDELERELGYRFRDP